jgi:hypothetical protein
MPQSIMYMDDAVSGIIRLMEHYSEDSLTLATKHDRNRATVANVDTDCPVSERDPVEAIRGTLLTQFSQDAVEQEVPLPVMHWNSNILLDLARYYYIGWNKSAPRCHEQHRVLEGS